MNILVVDDEPAIRELLGWFLQDAGHVVRTADNGQQAWECLSEPEAPVDVVIADVMMPVLSGRELLRRMRQADLRTPLVLVSGQINISQDDAKEAGACCIIHKPFDLSEVETVLQRVQAKRQGEP